MARSFSKFSKYYNSGWYDGSSGNTTTAITASALNNWDNWLYARSNDFWNYCTTDLTPTCDPTQYPSIPSSWQKIGTYSVDGVDKDFYIEKPEGTVTVTWLPGPEVGDWTCGTLTISGSQVQIKAPAASITPVLNSGTKIATFKNNSTGAATDIYAPNQTTVSYSSEQVSNPVKIGEITINGVVSSIYAPSVPTNSYASGGGTCDYRSTINNETVYEIFFKSAHYPAGSMLTGSTDIDIASCLPNGKVIDFVYGMDIMAKYDNGKWKELNGSGEGFDTVSYLNSDGHNVHFYTSGWIQDLTAHILCTLKDA